MNESNIWVKKYMPIKVSEVVGQDKVIERLQSYIDTGNMPNLLFSGLPGIGKTASAVAFAMELYGEYFSDNFYELNASDERGIDVVRKKIKSVASTNALGGFKFKIIFLDEGDALTTDAQSALRRTMETYIDSCRFILSCNYPSKIIEPILSRFSIFKFSRLKDDIIKEHLFEIIEKEDLKLVKNETNDIIDTILYIAEGDMRKAINTLQAASIGNDIITKESVLAVSVVINKEFVEKMIDLALDNKFIESRNYMENLMFDEGLSGEDITKGIFRYIMNSAIPDKILIELIEILGEIDFRMTEGANEYIQLNTLLASFVHIGSKYHNDL